MSPERAQLFVDRLFKKFSLLYGRLWLDTYASTGLSKEEVAAGWAEELTALTEQEVANGVRECKKSKFPPTLPAFLTMCRPASVSAWPTADEAWATALKANDENETVTWTQEICDAWAVCRPVLKGGDQVGARMAFKAAYDRIVAQANAEGRSPEWIISQGRDPEKRAMAVEAARTAGLLPAPVVEQFAPLLESRKEFVPPADIAERLASLRAALTRGSEPREVETDHDRTQRLKKAAAEQVYRMQGGAA